jgi:CRISPR-associated protein Csb2
MLTIKIELIANRYHANPWNRAHVEGMVEWPPSPWRILRAILAGGFAAKVEEPDLKSLVGKLSESFPSFYLPQGSYLQIRSPRKDLTGDTDFIKPGKDIVDAYLNFDASDRIIWIFWDNLDLAENEKSLLARCLAYCRYLGRREADAVWTIADEHPPMNARPDPTGITRVACSDGNIDNLLKSPYQSLAKELRSSVPGLIWQSYHVDEHPQKGLTFTPPTYYRAELIICTKGMPKAESTLVWSDRLHRSLVSKLPVPNFTGCDAEHNPLKTHDHIFIQPTIEHGVLNGFTLDSAQGFSDQELQILHGLCKHPLWFGKSEPQVRVVSLGIECGPASRVWTSVTPFFLTRYPLMRNGKPRLIAGTQYQKDGPEYQALTALCYLPQMRLSPSECDFQEHQQGLAMLSNGQVIAIAKTQIWPKSGQWNTDRKHGRKTLAIGFRVRLVFPDVVNGPIGIGYSAHMGLGCLRPQEDELFESCGLLSTALTSTYV